MVSKGVIMPKIKTEETKADAIALLAKAFGIPPSGINLEDRLGKKAYINAFGLNCAWKKHPEAVKIVSVERLSLYKTIGESAIVEVKAEDEKGNKLDSIGTASAANMNAVRGYPNELAETRAKNRVLRLGLMPTLYTEYEENVKKMTPEEVSTISLYVSDFGKVSAEEMEQGNSVSESIPLAPLTVGETKEIRLQLEQIVGMKSLEDAEYVKKSIKEDVDKSTWSESQKDFLRKSFKNKLDELAKDNL